jgi:hypothetical protein
MPQPTLNDAAGAVDGVSGHVEVTAAAPPSAALSDSRVDLHADAGFEPLEESSTRILPGWSGPGRSEAAPEPNASLGRDASAFPFGGGLGGLSGLGLGAIASTDSTAASSATDAAAAKPAEEEGLSVSVSTLLMILLTWASLATIVALWLWFHRPAPPSPLENLPDDGVIVRKNEIRDPLAPLGDRLTVPLEKTLRVGNLEVTPLSVAFGKVKIDPPDTGESGDVLLLKVRFKNISTNQTFSPTDPAFLYPDSRKTVRDLPMFNRRGVTYSFLQSDRTPNEISYCYHLEWQANFRLIGQEHRKLKPGESTETLIASEWDLDELLKGPVTWRLKLRKGQTRGGKGVATVIGVTFDGTQVKKVG